MDQDTKIVNKSNAKVFKATYGVINIANVKFGYIPAGFEVLHRINLDGNRRGRVVSVGVTELVLESQL